MLTILIERNPLIIDRYIFFLTKSLTNICLVLNQITLAILLLKEKGQISFKQYKLLLKLFLKCINGTTYQVLLQFQIKECECIPEDQNTLYTLYLECN